MNERTRGRLTLLLIAAIFLGPLLAAFWLYYGGGEMVPEGRTNHGVLLEPIVNLREVAPDSAIHGHNEEHWLLVYANTGACGEGCRFSLYTLRQSRLMLGREMERLKRVFLHGDTLPDTLFLAGEHQGLITIEDAGLANALAARPPALLDRGGYYLIDPLGNLVMYFEPDIDPGDVVDDIKHLFRLSRIG